MRRPGVLHFDVAGGPAAPGSLLPRPGPCDGRFAPGAAALHLGRGQGAVWLWRSLRVIRPSGRREEGPPARRALWCQVSLDRRGLRSVRNLRPACHRLDVPEARQPARPGRRWAASSGTEDARNLLRGLDGAQVWMTREAALRPSALATRVTMAEMKQLNVYAMHLQFGESKQLQQNFSPHLDVVMIP